MSSPRKSLIIGALAGAGVFLLGFFLPRIFGTDEQYGFTLFLLSPVAAGLTTALLVERIKYLKYALILSIAISLQFLIIAKTEGFVCVAMAFPLIFVGVILGAWLGVFVRQKIKKNNIIALILLLVPPTIGFSSHVEDENLWRKHSVSSSTILNANIESVWNSILRVDRMKGRKPFLMHLGLPVPQRCELHGTGIGAKRICYFNKGRIVEEVTEWKPPHTLGLRIVATELPGKSWLSFIDARYELSKRPNGTSVTRRTTLASRLWPKLYWEPLEKLGTYTEHDYMLKHLHQDLGKGFNSF